MKHVQAAGGCVGGGCLLTVLGIAALAGLMAALWFLALWVLPLVFLL